MGAEKRDKMGRRTNAAYIPVFIYSWIPETLYTVVFAYLHTFRFNPCKSAKSYEPEPFKFKVPYF
jgi:hypothetical protein